MDEIAYRKGRKFLTVVTGRVVHIAEGRTGAALAAFFDQLGGERRDQIRAVTMDMTRIYREPTREHLPAAAICFDPFTVNAPHLGRRRPRRREVRARPTRRATRRIRR
jgi:transposase